MPKPTSPKSNTRRKHAKSVRKYSTDLSASIPFPDHQHNHQRNNDLKNFPEGAGTFTKGLKHDDDYGRVDSEHLKDFIAFIAQADCNDFPYPDPEGVNIKRGQDDNYRRWESPLAGHVYSLMGMDADAISMPPAPEVGSSELAAEMAEIYALALLRDKTFEDIGSNNTATIKRVNQLVLDMRWFNTVAEDPIEEDRREARFDNNKLDSRVLYRGSTEGAKRGPYLSQFMLIGHANRRDEKTGVMVLCKSESKTYSHMVGGCPEEIEAKDGYILYGTQRIDQRTAAHKKDVDYMQNWDDWLKVQNGDDRKNAAVYEDREPRFIKSPRDLASYVHFDQLYQAYLNATLLLLGYGSPLDAGFPEGGKVDKLSKDACHPNRDGFATFGGPHVLSLVCEVASRALKFARRQKFNIHLRARPESIAALLTLHMNCKGKMLGSEKTQIAVCNNAQELANMLTEVAKVAQRKCKNENPPWLTTNTLLPMAFPEGSPMHPSYAAGHATVAGACVTVIKAFFEMFEVDRDNKMCPKASNYNPKKAWKEVEFSSIYGTGEDRSAALGKNPKTGIFEPYSSGKTLRELSESELDGPITILGELDKLAANISIGRNMAGVHYYTDYYESLRMGERVAVSILREQMLTYPEPVKMRFKSFDGDQIVLEGHGDGKTTSIKIADKARQTVDYTDWVRRRA